MAKMKNVVMHRKNRIGKGKRVSSRWVLLGVLALLSSQVIFPSIKAHAEGGEWRLIDTKNYDGKEQVDATNANGAYSATSSSSPGSYSYTWEYLGDTDTYYDPDLLNGENSSSICTFSVPPSVIMGGETVTLSLSLQFGAQMLSYFSDAASASADFDQWDVEPGYSADGGPSFKNAEEKDTFEINTYPSVNILSVSETITAIAPIGMEEGEKIALRTMFNGQKQGTCYIYEWYPEATATVTETTEEPLETEGVEGIEGIVGPEEATEDPFGETEEETQEEIQDETEGRINQIFESDASETGGETSTGILKKIITGIVAVAAVGGAGAAAVAARKGSKRARKGATDPTTEANDGDENESNGSSYRMTYYKDFGDKIKKNGDVVYVYARIVETNQEGVEIERLDLTQQIEIFSPDGILFVSSAMMTGEYKGAGVQYQGEEQSKTTEAKISFRYHGEGGVFQNNMTFQLVGEARIELENTQIFLLEGSAKCFELKYETIDFTLEPTVKVEIARGEATFTLETGTNKRGEKVIFIQDKGNQEPFDTFFQSYLCEVEAESEQETVQSRFYVEVCKEGIQADFLGKPNEIRGYRIVPDREEMEETIFDIKVGVWIEEKQTLEFVKPGQIEIELADECNVFGLIGTDIQVDEASVLTDRTRYIAKAKTNFPSTHPIMGTMKLSTTYNNRLIENEMELGLAPDTLSYEADKEKEYLACRRVIEIYMPSRFRGKKLVELERKYHQYGLADLREFRKNCWGIAERAIMQEGQEYLIEAAWYDEAIAYAELTVYIGDIAFDLALAPIGGPITGFIAAEVKTSFLEICKLYDTSPDKSMGEIILTFIKKRFEVLVGTADGLIKIPEKDNPKALAAWLGCYVIYRIGYHKYYDLDENNQPISIIEAVQNGLSDFVGKGAGILLGDYIKAQGKGRWVEKISVADRDEAFVNDKVQKAMKTGLDTMDEMADQADEIVKEVLDNLLAFIQKLKLGV